MSSAFDGIINFTNGVYPDQIAFSIPQIPEGDTAVVIIDDLQIIGIILSIVPLGKFPILTELSFLILVLKLNQ